MLSLSVQCDHAAQNWTHRSVKTIRWDEAKNERLKAERGVSFEAVLAALDRGDGLDDIPHPNQTRYPNQRILVVRIGNYGFLVPYVEDEHTVFLKTIYPSRSATKKYLRTPS